MEAAREPVRQRLRTGEVALARRLPAPGDGDRLVAATADGERLGHRDRGAHPRRVGRDGSASTGAAIASAARGSPCANANRARSAWSSAEPGLFGGHPRSARALRPRRQRLLAGGQDRFGVGGAVERQEQVPGADEGERGLRALGRCRETGEHALGVDGRPVAISARASASPAENPHPDWSAARAKPSSASLDMPVRTLGPSSYSVFASAVGRGQPSAPRVDIDRETRDPVTSSK